jgi:hypothetical protein
VARTSDLGNVFAHVDRHAADRRGRTFRTLPLAPSRRALRACRLIVILLAAAAAVALTEADAHAQRQSGGRGGARSASGGSAHGHQVVHRPVYPAYYVSPYWGSYYPAAFWWGVPYWGPGYGWYAFDAPGYVGESTARLLVTPNDTEVYVDGYLAGVVDDFDGVLQGLRLPSGSHTIELYREGHRPVRQEIYLSPGATYKIRHKMEPLAAGEPVPTRPVPSQAPAHAPQASTGPDDRESRDRPRDTTAIAIRVQPAGAQILIDGERWTGPDASGRLVVAVPPGRHSIEIRKDGYAAFSTNVDVPPGETLPLNVSLSRVEPR